MVKDSFDKLINLFVKTPFTATSSQGKIVKTVSFSFIYEPRVGDCVSPHFSKLIFLSTNFSFPCSDSPILFSLYPSLFCSRIQKAYQAWEKKVQHFLCKIYKLKSLKFLIYLYLVTKILKFFIIGHLNSVLWFDDQFLPFVCREKLKLNINRHR